MGGLAANAGETALAVVGAFMWIIPLFVVVGFGYAVYKMIRASGSADRRRDARAQAVAAYGYGYLEEDPARTTYFRSPPFGAGGTKSARDIIWGSAYGRQFE